MARPAFARHDDPDADLVATTVPLTRGIIRRLDALAIQQTTSRAQVIRQACLRYLAANAPPPALAAEETPERGGCRLNDARIPKLAKAEEQTCHRT